MKLKCIKSILLVTIIYTTLAICSAHAEGCGAGVVVYGENDIVDQLLACSVGKSFDLDLTPRGDHTKGTPKTLIEQGLSNKTTVVFARLSGLWSARRTSLVDSAWRCEANKTISSAIIELNGLSLEMVEKFDVPIHRSQQKLSLHKPCKTFDLPLWMCRQTKPIYRTTRTWVNRAFFNLTLVQSNHEHKPALDSLVFMFSCPETFRQKITHSPSAMYMLSKFIHGAQEAMQSHNHTISKRNSLQDDNKVPIPHPVSFSTNQDGKGLASPPYHFSVNLITKQMTDTLSASIDSCISSTDCDLSLMRDSISYSKSPYANRMPIHSDKPKTGHECSSKDWLAHKLQASEEANLSPNDISSGQLLSIGHSKRSQFGMNFPKDPNQLLDPFSYYHDNFDRAMIDDE